MDMQHCLSSSTKGLTQYVYSRRRMLRLHMGKSTASWRELQEQTVLSSWPFMTLDWTVSLAPHVPYTDVMSIQPKRLLLVLFWITFPTVKLPLITYWFPFVFPSSRQILLLDTLQPRGHAGDHPAFALLSRWSTGADRGSKNSANCVSTLFAT